MFILKKGHQPGVYVPLRALFLVRNASRYRTSGCDKGASLYPVLTTAFLKALNKPYV